jgi:hypothetical protein
VLRSDRLRAVDVLLALFLVGVQCSVEVTSWRLEAGSWKLLAGELAQRSGSWRAFGRRGPNGVSGPGTLLTGFLARSTSTSRLVFDKAFTHLRDGE